MPPPNDNPLERKNQAWSARFNEPMSELTKRFNASIGFDWRMWREDIEGSVAHARMLGRQGIISAADVADIERGMAQIAKEIEAGEFTFSIELEDIHLNIERRLTQLIGDAGKRLHTGRSRNDQVITDVRLHTRKACDVLLTLLVDYQRALVRLAEQHTDTIMPGFTHLQVAQPVTFGHHVMAYVEMAARDHARLTDARRRINQLTLGAAALAGTTFDIDRASVAKELGFEGVCANSMDAVSDRDFAIEFVGACSLIMIHLSRLSEEIVTWMNPRFGFVTLPDRFCTGSSIMPQKKNPDILELIRGKTGRVQSHWVALTTLMKGQALTFNKDNQEDKEPLFDTIDTLTDTLRIMVELVPGITPRKDHMRMAASEGFATATDLADYLVRKGLPFREAHEVVSHAVRAAEQAGKDLEALPLATLQTFSDKIGSDVFECLTLEGSVAARNHFGGTAPAQVRAAIAAARARLG